MTDRLGIRASRAKGVRLNRWVAGLTDLDRRRLNELLAIVFVRGYLSGLTASTRKGGVKR